MKNFPKTLKLIEEKISYFESIIGKTNCVAQQTQQQVVKQEPTEPYVCKMKTEELVNLFYKADLRVGQIVKAEKHPESQKLYIEQIDMGNGEVRQILSGLQQFYQLEQVTGKVVVFYNLKPKKLAGMDSAGMVMCASDKDHKECFFLRPEDSTQLGSRLVLKNYPVPQLTEGFISNNHLKKFLEMLRTDENGQAYFGNEPISVEKYSLQNTPIRNGNIS